MGEKKSRGRTVFSFSISAFGASSYDWMKTPKLASILANNLPLQLPENHISKLFQRRFVIRTQFSKFVSVRRTGKTTPIAVREAGVSLSPIMCTPIEDTIPETPSISEHNRIEGFKVGLRGLRGP